MTHLNEHIATFKELDSKRSTQPLSDEEQRRYDQAKEAIERAQGEDLPPSSRRRTLRVPIDLEVSFDDARGFARAYLRNISEGGVYVETPRPLTMGTRLRLRIVVREPAATVELPVEVVWVNAKPSVTSGLAPGVGVAWLELSDANRATIKRIVHQALDGMSVTRS